MSLIFRQMGERCFICLECDGRTFEACGCKGGVQHVHRDCLVRWMSTGRRKCAVCRQQYLCELGLADRLRSFVRDVVDSMFDLICLILAFMILRWLCGNEIGATVWFEVAAIAVAMHVVNTLQVAALYV